MINTQTNNPYEILQKPELSRLRVTQDGEPVVSHGIGRIASYAAKMAGYGAFKIATLGFKALDHAIEATN